MGFLEKIKNFLANENKANIKPAAPHVSIYNLQEIYEHVNSKYFEGKIANVRIEWSKRLTKQARVYRRLGSYYPERKLIRVNPILDNPDFPPYFISYIVYHEILHHVYPPFRKKGKWQIHHSTFKEKEKEFEEYLIVKQWEKENKKRFFRVLNGRS